VSAHLAAALAAAAALFAAWCLALRRGSSTTTALMRGQRGGPPGGVGAENSEPQRRSAPRWAARQDPAIQLHIASLLVAQLGALLRAGRTPEQMWRQAADTHLAVQPAGVGAGVPRLPALDRRAGCRGGEREGGGDDDGPILEAAAHAAALGRPVADAIREACGRPPSRSRLGGPRTEAAVGVWLNVAACIETAEASGSPLADVLDRLAGQLEADADAAAARAVALAGPRATAQVLSVLPIAGLGLGLLMGADPLATLLQTPLGSLCLGLGFGLTAVGRWWSTRLVASASEVR
jgi:tight adherence protein B